MLGVQSSNVGIDLLLVQGVPEPQDCGQQHEAQGGNQSGDGEDTIQNSLGLTGTGRSGGRVVADPLQQPAGEACGKSLTQLTGEGVQSVDGTVLADAVLDLGVVDNVGDQSPGDHGEDTEAQP